MPEKTLNEVFSDIADAIRGKAGTSESIKPIEMADEITNIPAGPTPTGNKQINLNNWGALTETVDVTNYATATVGYDGSSLHGYTWYHTSSSCIDNYQQLSGLYYFDDYSDDNPNYVSLESGKTYYYRGNGDFEEAGEIQQAVYHYGEYGLETLPINTYFIAYCGINTDLIAADSKTWPVGETKSIILKTDPDSGTPTETYEITRTV